MNPAVLATIDAVAASTPIPWGASVAAGILVGLSLGLTGGGGAIFAVPLLVYWIGVDPRTAVSISLVTVAATALFGAVERWWYGQVEVRTGLLFAAAGMLTAPAGSWLGGQVPPQTLMVAFAGLMVLIAGRMWRKASDRIERTGAGPRLRRCNTLRRDFHHREDRDGHVLLAECSDNGASRWAGLAAGGTIAVPRGVTRGPSGKAKPLRCGSG